MIIRKITNEDIPEVASIHFKHLKVGVLSHLGEKFLREFYKSLLKQNSTFTLVAFHDSKIIGFATGAINLQTVPKALITDLWLPTLFAIIKNPVIAVKLLQTPFYPSFKTNVNIGEIFSLAVIPGFRRQGIGSKLINSCKKEFKKRDCDHFQISVRKKMLQANSFYLKMKLRKKASGKFLNEEIIYYGN